jgi:hypothetical protein
VQVPRVARFLAWFCGLEALWLVFVGTTQSTEIVAGSIAAAVVALFVDALRAVGLLGFRLSPGTLAQAWTAPWHVVFDFGLVLWLAVASAARGRRVRGRFVSVPFDEEAGAHGRFRRALTAMLENESANGMVVDIDDGRVLLHSLDTRVSTGKQVL